jgi:predicted extracellular nuclease
VINEAYSRGVTGNLDWVEVYNPSGAAIDISGYKIYDDGGQAGSKDKKPFPAGTVLPAYGFYAIITDTATTGLNDKFGLSSTGDKVWLENTTGTIIDSVVIPALGVDTSVARQTNGDAVWVKLSPVTRGTSNSQVLLNEAYSRGTAGNRSRSTMSVMGQLTSPATRSMTMADRRGRSPRSSSLPARPFHQKGSLLLSPTRI